MLNKIVVFAKKEAGKQVGFGKRGNKKTESAGHKDAHRPPLQSQKKPKSVAL